MAGELVFITGAIGFIGFAVLTQLLQSGYRVRISLRKESQISSLSNHALVSPYVFQGKVEFVVVPDITVSGAFDKVLNDAVYVEHLASKLPHPTNDPENDIILPAIHGTTSLLNSALLHSSIKRIVITSSVAALLSSAAQYITEPRIIYNANSRVTPHPTGPYVTASDAYRASKALAIHATDAFIEEQKPKFSVVNVIPGYVIGRNELADSREKLIAGSNHVVLNIVTGIASTNKVVGTVVDVRDVARVQVEALDEAKVPGSYRSFVVEEPVELNEAVAISKNAFPEAFEMGILKEGSSISVYQIYEGKETREIFGELKTYEEMVKSVVGQYVELEK